MCFVLSVYVLCLVESECVLESKKLLKKEKKGGKREIIIRVKLAKPKIAL